MRFWLALAMLALVVTQLAVHRAWIASWWTRRVGSPRSPRTWMLLGAGLLLMVLPLVIPASIEEPSRPKGGGRGAAMHKQHPRTKQVAHARKKGKPNRPRQARPTKRQQRPRPKR